VIRALIGAGPQFYEPVWFATSLGWAVARLSRPPTRLRAEFIWIAAALLAGYYFVQQVGYLNDLALGYPDCGEIARRMHNTIHRPDLFLRVNPDKPLFFDHVDPGILPVISVWRLWPDLRVTILLQLVAVLGSVVPLYWVGRQLFGDKSAASWLALAWLVYPSTSLIIYSGSYGFRWGNLCLPLYFAALALWLRGKTGWALAAALWAISIKEEAAIPIGMFGLYLALVKRRRLAGALLAASAFGYFLLATSVIIPAFSPRGYELNRYFAGLGETKWEILLAPLIKPGAFWGRLFERETLCLLGALLAPLLFVPATRPAILAVGAPVILFICMDQSMKSLGFWWQLSLLPVVFWALADAAKQTRVLPGAVAAGLVMSLFLGNTFWSKPTIPIPRAPGRAALIKEFRAEMPIGASLFATPRAAAFFIDQQSLYLGPPLPADLECALIDLRTPWRESGGVRWLQELRTQQRAVEARGDLRLLKAQDGLLFYANYGDPLDARSIVETNAPAGVAIPLTAGVSVAGFSIKGGDPVRITIFSRVATATNVDVAVRCLLHYGDASFTSKFQPLGQGIWPVNRWDAGKLYVDEFSVTVPRGLDPSDFSLEFEAALLP